MDQKLVKFYYVLISILEQMSHGWFAATYVLFLVDSGLPFWEGMLANVVYHLTMGLFDPITGYIGDKIGHLRIYAIGIFIYFIGDFVYFFARGLFAFSVAEFVLAIGAALMSEAIDSWLKNRLGVANTHTLRASADLSRMALILPAIIGALVGSVSGRQYPFLLSAATAGGILVTSLLLIWRAKDAGKMETLSNPEDPIFTRFIDSLKELGSALLLAITVKPIRQVLIFSFFSAIAYQSFNMLWTIQLLNMSGGDSWLGFVWIGISTAIALGSYRVRKLINPTLWNISVLYLVIVLPMLLAATGQTVILVLAGFCLHEVGRGAERHILTTFADHHIPDEYRATLNSARSGSRWLGGALGLFIIFFLGSAGIMRQPQQFWLVSSLIIALLGLYAIWLSKKQ